MFLTIKPYLHLNCMLMLNWIIWNRTVSTLKLYLHLNELLHLTAWIVWNRNVFDHLNCVIMLNWIVLKRTDYLHKNGFGVK